MCLQKMYLYYVFETSSYDENRSTKIRPLCIVLFYIKTLLLWIELRPDLNFRSKSEVGYVLSSIKFGGNSNSSLNLH